MRTTRLGIVLALAALVAVAPVLAGGKIEVKIGESASTAKVSKDHNVTPDALEKAKGEGHGEFWVKDKEGATHKIHLDGKQIADLLDGTTVMVDTEKDPDGKMATLRVSLEMKEDKPAKSSGW